MLYTFNDLLGMITELAPGKGCSSLVNCEHVSWGKQVGGNFFFPGTITCRC